MKSPMNGVWFGLLLAAVLSAAASGNMEAVTKASFASAKSAVELAIGLIGPMALWLGLMKIAEEGGLLKLLAKGLRPVMTRLFPDVPADHPAMSSMILNLSSNALGLGNAATPFGVKAMTELEKLNPRPGRATNAMCLFLAINTSNVTFLPLGVMAVRAAAGVHQPADILFPTLFATTISTLVAVAAAKLYQKGDKLHETEIDASIADTPPVRDEQGTEPAKGLGQKITFSKAVVTASFLLLAILAARQILHAQTLPQGLSVIASHWLIPVLMLALAGYGLIKRVPVYEAACEGAKEGFNVAVRILPYLVLILTVIGMFRASGGFDFAVRLLEPVTSILGFPPEVLPVALLRPLSGSGAFALMSDIVVNSPNSFGSFLASTIQGSTETTFYVLAVYFGAAGVKDPRHAVWAALTADLAGIIASLFICRLMW